MDLTMRISEFEWRECDHNMFSGRTSSIHARGRVWSKNANNERRVICASGINLGWFHATPSSELNDLIEETNRLVVIDLMFRNVIPKQWPDMLTDSGSDDYPFRFKLTKTVLVDPEWILHSEDAADQSYVVMSIWSKHHEGLTSTCELELPDKHIRKVFDKLDKLI